MSDSQSSLVDKAGRAIVPVEFLGRGMQGVVHRTRDGDAVKVLKHPDERALLDRMGIPDDAFVQPSGQLAKHRWIIWPRTLAFDESTGRLVGYTMPYVPIARPAAGSTPERDGPWTTLNAVQHWSDRVHDGFDVSFRWTLRTMVHLATAAAWAEHRGVHAVDLNPRNVALHLKTGVASLLDPDGIATSDATPPIAEDLRPLELIEERAATAEGVARWALAVTVIQTLLQGRHPFAGVRIGKPAEEEASPTRNLAAGWCGLTDPYGGDARWPALPNELLSSEVYQLALRCFGKGRENPAIRPTAAEWAEALARMDEGLVGCARSRRHFHLPAEGDRACPFCVTAQNGVDIYPTPSATATAEDAA